MALTNRRANDALSGRGTGSQSIVLRFFNDDGQDTTGDISAWSQADFLEWKNFCLRTVDHLGVYNPPAQPSGEVEIQAAMTLANIPANTEYTVLATLDGTTRAFSTERPWRYLRCEITVDFGSKIVVEMMGINK